MYKIDKKTAKQIRQLAKDMPNDTEPYLGKKRVTGADIIHGKAMVMSIDKQGNIAEKKFVPEQPLNTFKVKSDYMIGTVMIRVKNHKNRMKKAYTQKGWDGVLSYMDPYLTKEAKEKMKLVAE